MDIKTFSIIELKAMVYDQMVIAEAAQKNILILNKELELRKSDEKLNDQITKTESTQDGTVLDVPKT